MSKKKNKPKTPIDYTCSYCGAKPKARCTNRHGQFCSSWHIARVRQRNRNRSPSDLPSDAFEEMPDGSRRDAMGNVPTPLPNRWRAAFLKSTLRTGFCLALTQPMLEMLCAVADGVQWDRSVFRHSMGNAMPDNTIGSAGGLERRGLIRHRGTRVLRDESANRSRGDNLKRWNEHICDSWELTPAGEKIVELLKLTGVFVEQAAATDIKARARRQEGS